MKNYYESIFRLSTILVTANCMNINASLNVNYFVGEPSRPAAVCLSLEEQEISQQSRAQEKQAQSMEFCYSQGWICM